MTNKEIRAEKTREIIRNIELKIEKLQAQKRTLELSLPKEDTKSGDGKD